MKHFRTITVLGGAGIFLYGLWTVYHPLAPIVGGLACVYVGILLDREHEQKESRRGPD